MCLCTSPMAACKPTDRARTLGRLLYYVMIILLILLIFGFIGGYFQLSILAIFLIITGWCGVRNNDSYNIEQILCVTFFSGYILVYTVVDVILKIIAYKYDLPIFALISLFGGVIFYAAACIISKILYDELRTNYVQVVDPNVAGPSFLQRLQGMGTSRANAPQSGNDNDGAEAMPLVVQQRGQIPPNRGDRGRPLGVANSGNNGRKKKFEAFKGAGHSVNE